MTLRVLLRTVLLMETPRLDPDRVTKARYTLGISSAELARRAGLSKQTISDIENGRRPGSPETHKAIADALGVTPSELWTAAA